jgi:dTDP-6-deoxy-L-talose 4-dehydrogenase (NAD+)
LLTGATGFIGKAVLPVALQDGHQLAALVRPERTESFSKDFPEVELLQGSLEDVPWSRIESFAPDACLHSAWLATPGVYLESPQNDQYVLWSKTFCRQLGQYALKRLVVLGTCIEYAPSEKALEENISPLGPRSAYARAKSDLRESLFDSPELKKTRITWGRVFYPYGPGENPGRIPSMFARTLQAGNLLQLRNPHSTKDFIYIQDLAEAIVRLLKGDCHGAINLGTGIGCTIETLARMLNDELGGLGKIELANPPISDAYPYLVANPSRLHDLGWRPKMTLAAGLRTLLRDLNLK